MSDEGRDVRLRIASPSGHAQIYHQRLKVSDAIEIEDTIRDDDTFFGRLADALELMFIVGDIRITCGMLRSAYSLYQRGFEMLRAATPGTNLIGQEDLYRGVVDVYREWGDWNAAEDHLMAAEELGAMAISRPDWHHRLNLSAARLALSQGNFDQTLAFSEAAQQHYSPSPIPPVRSAAAVIARVWIQQGNLSAATKWARETALEEITYQTEFGHIAYARLLLAQGAYGSLHSLLKRLLRAAQAGDRTGSAIEILTLQALAYHAIGDDKLASAYLDAGLTRDCEAMERFPAARDNCTAWYRGLAGERLDKTVVAATYVDAPSTSRMFQGWESLGIHENSDGQRIICWRAPH